MDIAGVASVLKGYFRELQVPLFPTDNYKAFIDCTREADDPLLERVCVLLLVSAGKEDVTTRLENIQNTLTLVHPVVVKVMQYLFRFLYR